MTKEETSYFYVSPAECDPVKAQWLYDSNDLLCENPIGFRSNGNCFTAEYTNDPQDIGIETFSTDTLEGGMPDD